MAVSPARKSAFRACPHHRRGHQPEGESQGPLVGFPCLGRRHGPRLEEWCSSGLEAEAMLFPDGVRFFRVTGILERGGAARIALLVIRKGFSKMGPGFSRSGEIPAFVVE
jgi:hypothetical protein